MGIRYIDADAYIQYCEDKWIPLNIDAVNAQPTADVVKVVRCRDCKWYKSIYSWNCKEHKVCVRDPYEPPREPNDYCSYGERKEDERK